jgi:hypothetical protein
MSKIDLLRDTLSGAAQDIAGASSHPDTWRASVLYLLEMLESEAPNRHDFESMLSNLCDDLAIRLEDGRWQIS